MTDRRVRDLRRLRKAEAGLFGAAVMIEHTCGGHIKALFSIGNQQAFITTSSPNSAWRQHRHVRADARRSLKSLTIRTDMKGHDPCQPMI